MKNHATLGKGLKIDLGRMIETRLLIQANSGGGKSWAIRKLLEESHGAVQHIVLDPEGEFATLREKFDYVLAGKEGDIPADPRHAGVLARKILDLGASLIVDLYELKQHQRISFVRSFLEAMVNAPKNLWHPVLVILDEAHVFAPEKSPAESTGAVVDLETRGRKRGFCLIPATQRLSKLNKDVAAECNNKLIGRTGLDIDVKRASEELGMTTKEGQRVLSRLDAGEFYAFGPAISREVILTKVGPVKTTHPTTGRRLAVKTKAPTARVRSVLGKLKDLPERAEAEIQDMQQAKVEIRNLKGDLTQAKRTQGASPEDLKQAETRGLERGKNEIMKMVSVWRSDIEASSKKLGFVAEKMMQDTRIPEGPRPSITTRHIPPPAPTRHHQAPQDGNDQISRCERGILGFLVSYPGRTFTKVQVAVMSGYSHSSGGFNNAIYHLSSQGYVRKEGSSVGISESGLSLGIEAQAGGIDSWVSRLSKCERAVFQCLMEASEGMSKEMLGQATNYSPTSGGFNNAIYHLSSLGLTVRNGNGTVSINPEITEL